jgi:chloramphenicol-sensitive protein RarD
LKNKQHFSAALSAFVIWGFIAWPLKALHAFESNQILYYRIAFAVTILLLLVVLFRRKALIENIKSFRENTAKVKRKELLLIAAGGLLLTTNWLSFIYTVNHISIQAGSFAYLVCPILTAGLAYVALQENLRPLQWLSVALSLAACCLIGIDSFYNLMFSMLIATSYSLYLITQRLLKNYDRIILLTIQLVLSFVVINLFGSSFRGIAPTENYFYLHIFSLSSLFTVLPLFLNLFALKELKSATLGILMYINPMINFALACIYYGETISTTQALAYTIILSSVVLYNLRFQPKPKPALEAMIE